MPGDTTGAVDDRLEEASGRLPITRRSFLATSGVAVTAGGATYGLDDLASLVARSPDEIVLSKADLTTPPSGGYVADDTAAEDAQMIKHLKTSIAGFRTAETATSAFAATDDAEVPKYVESAAVAVPEGVLPGVVAVRTGAWLTERYEGTSSIESFDHETGSFAEQWHSRTDNGWRDVLRLEHVGDGLLTFTVAYGRESAAQTPSAAVDHYASVMQERAFERV